MKGYPIFGVERTKRVIVGPHGLFIAQRNHGGKGVNAHTENGVKVAHYDPWQNIQRPTDNLMLAKQQAGVET